MKILLVIGLILGVVLFIFLVKKTTKKPVIQIVVFVLYLFAILVFMLCLGFHSEQYNVAIDPLDYCYIPFGQHHATSILFYILIYHVAIFLIWIRGNRLPPLLLVLCFLFVIIGTVLNVMMILQITGHNTDSFEMKGSSHDGDTALFFSFMPLMSILIAIWLIFRVISAEKSKAPSRSYKNRFLDRCNAFLANDEATWAMILLIPVLVVITLILILFGQDADSLVKAFTETTTWRFSQHSHPPNLSHSGHYLCTVAARGNPNIVKPICVGNRHGKPIIVNRQLQIANAFEEMA